jgi:peptidyl-tRNA hydrolase, PTH1 family
LLELGLTRPNDVDSVSEGPARSDETPDAEEQRNTDEPRKWIVVGLGNPGDKYADTPHNLGFMVVDRLALRHSARLTRKECQAIVGAGNIGGQKVTFAKPQTFMNLSGVAVKSLLTKNSMTADDLIVVYDELDLPWTGLRIRGKGSAGGHNGVKSILGNLGTMDFKRIRLGIHPGHPVSDGAKFVLAPFGRAQKKELDELLDYASDAVETIIAEGVEKAMTRFNRRALGSDKEEA